MLSSSLLTLDPSPLGCTSSKDFRGAFQPLLFKTMVRMGIL